MPFRKRARNVIRLDQAEPATEPQEFIKTVEVDSGIAQTWKTSYGLAVVIFPNVIQNFSLNRRQWQTWLAEVDWCRFVVLVGNDRGIHGGPSVFVHDRQGGDPGKHPFHYEMSWANLNGALGQPAPYWATFLRTMSGMAGWSPAEPVRAVAAAPEVDLGPVLRLAARHAPDTALHQALLAFAQSQLADAAKVAAKDIEFQEAHRDDTGIRFAAVPATVTIPEEPLDPAVVRAGWLNVLDLTDDDAYAAVATFSMFGRQSKTVLPASTIARVHTDDGGADEWIARLRPTQRTAKFALLDGGPEHAALIDPVTEAVVAFDGDDTYIAAVPSRLATASPLSSIEMQPGRVWIITEDGTRYLCPETSSVDVNWGYNGSGPRMLAEVLHALLEDINIDVAVGLAVAPPGLVEFCKRPWEPGTVLTRKELEEARQA